jgi:hypothetical protein
MLILPTSVTTGTIDPIVTGEGPTASASVPGMGSARTIVMIDAKAYKLSIEIIITKAIFLLFNRIFSPFSITSHLSPLRNISLMKQTSIANICMEILSARIAFA